MNLPQTYTALLLHAAVFSTALAALLADHRQMTQFASSMIIRTDDALQDAPY